MQKGTMQTASLFTDGTYSFDPKSGHGVLTKPEVSTPLIDMLRPCLIFVFIQGAPFLLLEPGANCLKPILVMWDITEHVDELSIQLRVSIQPLTVLQLVFAHSKWFTRWQ